MVRISVGEAGELVVRSTEDSLVAFKEAAVGVSLVAPVVYEGLDTIALDPGERLLDLAEFVRDRLGKAGVTAVLDDALVRLVEYRASERLLLNELKAGSEIVPCHGQSPPDFIRGLLGHQTARVARAIQLRNPADFSVPGSGKTAVALAYFDMLRSANEVDLLFMVGPVSSFEPWETEVSECLGVGTSVVRWTGSIHRRRELLSALSGAKLVLCNYQTACRDADLIEQVLRQYRTILVLDESHYIKNFAKGVRATTMLRLAPFAARRMVLTGTPAPHSLLDLWNQMTFLWPSQQLLGSRYDFEVKVRADGAVKAIGEAVRPFFMRIKKSDLGLPAPAYEILRVGPDEVPPSQRRLIRLLELQTLSEARAQLPDRRDLITLRLWRAARVIRLLQASSNPALMASRLQLPVEAGDATEDVGTVDVDLSSLDDLVRGYVEQRDIPAKVRVVVRKARELVGQGKKIIIWTWFVQNLFLLKDILSDLNPLLLYGGIKPYSEEDDDYGDDVSREQNIHLFKTEPTRQVLIANPAACAESISLHMVCHDALYLDRTFNCGQFLQSMDRIHRVGLPPSTVTTYYAAFLDCAIEKTVDAALSRRQEVLYKLMDDPMPVLSLEDEDWDTGSLGDLDKAYADMVERIEHS